MFKWLIVADSSCDIKSFDTGSVDIGFMTVPFLLRMGHVDYTDDVGLSSKSVIELMEKSDRTCTACPSPEVFADAFAHGENVIAITISSNLSGSYDSAMIGRSLALESDPNKKIWVIDSKATGPKLVFMIQAILCQIKAQESFDSICEFGLNLVHSVKTLFMLSSFQNLVKNGRMNKIVGTVANQLGIRAVGEGTKDGRIHVLELIRGEKRALKVFLNLMEKSGFDGVSAVISHCLNEQVALQLRDMIVDKWKNAVVQILPTRGLDTYYAERGGLILSFDTCC